MLESTFKRHPLTELFSNHQIQNWKPPPPLSATYTLHFPFLFIGRTDAEAETPILWPLDAESWLIGKDPDAGRVWGQEEKGTTEDETAGWHHRLDGHGFGWTLGVGDGQGGLACCDSQGRKKSDMIEWLNWTELILFFSMTFITIWYIVYFIYLPILSLTWLHYFVWSYISGSRIKPRK